MIIQTKCSSCSTYLKISVAKGANMPDDVKCKACSTGKIKKQPRRYVRWNLS